MNWNEAYELMKTARDKTKGKPIGNNTRLYFESAWKETYYSIRLHDNEIMRIYKDRIVPLDGGWQTVTTKARLNEHLPQGFYVFQKNWDWFIRAPSKNINEPFVYDFGDVKWIHNNMWFGRVMLYSTHPDYPEEYSENELNGDE
jgi:hypothetical protein